MIESHVMVEYTYIIRIISIINENSGGNNIGGLIDQGYKLTGIIMSILSI